MAASRSGKPVFVVNAAVSVALVVLVAAVALVVNPPSPPGIAAFAPQAAKPITKAPPGQSSANGTGVGACAVGQVCTGPSASPRSTAKGAAPAAEPTGLPSVASTAPITGVPSALQCFQWPDGAITQTFDPQSPPCVASWPGQAKGNGGRTAQGVNGATIRVAEPTLAANSEKDQVQPIVDFINSHFELYGRRIQLVPFDSKQQDDATMTGEDPEGQKADADQVSSLKVFASLDFVDTNANDNHSSALPSWVDGLRHAGVISLLGGEDIPDVSDQDLASDSPYAFSYLPTVEDLLQQTAVMACAQLVGRDATHAAKYAGTTRTFGLVLPDSSEYGGPIPGLSKVLATLAGCGISNPPIIYTNHSDSGTLQASMIKLKQEGVTTLLYLPHLGLSGTPAEPMASANTVNYDPEWVIAAPTTLTGANIAFEPVTETHNAFGVTILNKLLPPASNPWYQAFVQAGGSQTTATQLISGSALYHELLVLASGVQAAGPHLTAKTFAAALQGTTFPNPGAAQGPSYQATVGFPTPGAAMVRDYAGWWPDPSANEVTTEQDGAAQATDDWQNYCWDNVGVRYADGSWPHEDRFRQGACR